FSRAGRLRLLVVAAEVVVVALVALPALRPVGILLAHPLVPAAPERVAALAHPALAAFLLAAGLVLVRVVRHGSTTDGGVFWALVGAALALGGVVGLASTVYFATAGLVLV